MTRRPSQDKLNAILDQAAASITHARIDLPELLRRREHEVSDGYPSTSMGGGGASIGSVSNPTARAALARKEDDPVAKAIDVFLDAVRELHDLSQTLDNNRTYALHLGDAGRERQSTVRVCEACERPVMGGKDDPWRKGLCNTHYKAFMRWAQDQREQGAPDADRHRWLHLYRHHLVEETS